MGQYNLLAEITQTLDIAKTLVHPQPDEAIRLANYAAERANTLGHSEEETRAWLIKLLAYRARPQTTSAEIEEAALNTLRLAQNNLLHDTWIEALNCHADILYGFGHYDAAMDQWLQLLEAGLELNWPYAKALAYIGIGKLFWIFEDPQACMEYSNKAKDALQNVEQIEPKACLIINLAAYAYQRRQYDLSHQYLDQAEQLLKTIAFCEYEPEIYYYRGYLLRAAGQTTPALEQLKRALVLNAHSNNNWGKAVTMIGLGEIYLELGEAHKALYFMQQSLTTAMAAPNHYRYLVMQAHEGLAKCYNMIGQTENEFSHWAQHFDLSDTLMSEVMNHRLASFKRHSLQLRVHELEHELAVN
jgi:tetratricopeptide (TPR) repeat protein